MAVFQWGGPTRRRRPSLRKGVVQDISRGQERSRAWPQPRGKAAREKVREQNDWFRQAQWACKYWPAEFVQEIREAIAGTPLLYRDLMTMIMAGRAWMIDLDEGWSIYSMASRRDVSESLDALWQFQGGVLVRGPEFWENAANENPGYVLTSQGAGNTPIWQPSGGGGGTAWQLAGFGQSAVGIYDFAVDGAKANIDFTGLAGFNELLVIARQLPCGISGSRALYVSVDDGASYFQTTGDYRTINTAGVEANTSALAFHSTATTAARSFVGHLVNMQEPIKYCQGNNNTTNQIIFTASASPVDAIRVANTSGGPITGGTVQVLAR